MLLRACGTHLSLISISMGQSYATSDLGVKYNVLDDTCADAIVSLIKDAPTLKNLSLDHCAITNSTHNLVIRALLSSKTMFYITLKPLEPWPLCKPLM